MKRLLKASSALVIVGAMTAPAGLLAQTTEMPATPSTPVSTAAATAGNDAADTIVITGSRIRRDPLNQDAPVVFVEKADIERTGLTSIADVLQRLPGSGGGINSKLNASGNLGNPPDGGGVGAGAAEVDLRYLGSKRTLVLVDGLRWVNGASASGVPGSIDLNTIPAGMIERVEVLQDGASAVYGSDAIAGVVNIITKSGQKGLQASAQHGLFDAGDGVTRSYSLSWGNGTDGPTKIVIGANYDDQGEVKSATRDISRFPQPGLTACNSSCSSNALMGRFRVLGRDLTVNGPIIGRAPTLADMRDFTTADRFNFAPFNYMLTPNERYGAFARLSHAFGDVNLHGKIVYNRRNSRNEAAPLPLGIGPSAGNGNLLDYISIDATNPYNPFGVTLESGFNLDGTLNGRPSNYSALNRRLVEAGTRQYVQSADTYYGSVTLDGRFNVGSRKWFWDVNGIYGRNKAHQTMLGNVDSSKLAVALGPVSTCAATAGCVPFNYFGGAGSITKAMLDYVTFTQKDRSAQRIWGVSGNISGSLLDLPGGPLGVALGAEHRKLTGQFDPDPVVAAGHSSDIPALPTRGGYAVTEFYGELNLPLAKQMAFADLLELSVAARRSSYDVDNSDRSFSATTLKASLNWKPVRDLRIRAGWGQGFRAPSIGELFGSPSRFDSALVDPCAGLNANSPAALKSNCIANGVPADFSYKAQSNAQISVVTGGNLALKPEKSKGWNIGAVYSPEWARRASLEVNYYAMTIDGAIDPSDPKTQLTRCANEGDALSCAAIRRAPSGEISVINGLLQNIAGIDTRGIDATLSYRSPEIGAGRFGLFWTNNWLLKYDISIPSSDGVTKVTRRGTERGSPMQAYPKFKSTGTVDWTARDWALSLTGRYIGAVTEIANDLPSKMASRFYTDAQMRLMPAIGGSRAFGFAVGVNNLFNVAPPPCFSCDLNGMDPTTYDVPGRFIYARVNFGF